MHVAYPYSIEKLKKEVVAIIKKMCVYVLVCSGNKDGLK